MAAMQLGLKGANLRASACARPIGRCPVPPKANRAGRVRAAAVEIQTYPRTCPDFLALRGTLFDIDGTLGNSDPLHFQVFQESLLALGFNNGVPITDEWFMENISGRHNPQINAELFPEKSEEWRTNWCNNREARFRELAATSLQPIKGLKRFAAWVKGRGLRRAAVTNAPRVNAEVMINGLGMKDFFETVVIGDECLRPKPFPDPYMEGLVRINLRHVPQLVLCLEDSPAGVRSAVAAGMPVVGLLTGQPRHALEAAGADIIVNDFDELMELIEAQEAKQQAAKPAASAEL